MSTVITVANQKGGVGKSTTADAIGAGLIARGYKVLFVDEDAQGNLSYTLQAKTAGVLTLADLLQNTLKNGTRTMTFEAIQHMPDGDVIASSPALAGTDTVFADTVGREYKLKEILEPVLTYYDYVVIDTPPTLGTLTVNALTAADWLIAPVQADTYSLIAVDQLAGTLNTVKKYCNPKLEFKGVLLTRYNKRTILSREVAERLSETAASCGTKLFGTRIRECTAIKEAQLMRQSIFAYAPKSNAAADYGEFLGEIL